MITIRSSSSISRISFTWAWFSYFLHYIWLQFPFHTLFVLPLPVWRAYPWERGWKNRLESFYLVNSFGTKGIIPLSPFMHTGAPSSQASCLCPHPPSVVQCSLPIVQGFLSDPISVITIINLASVLTPASLLFVLINVIWLSSSSWFWIKDLFYWVHFRFPTTPKHTFFSESVFCSGNVAIQSIRAAP